MVAPFRFKHPASGSRDVAAGQADSPGQYMERLLKLIPAEAVALYLVGAGIVPKDQPWALVGWTVVCFIAVIVVRTMGTADPKEGEKPVVPIVVLSCVAFVLWIYSIGGPFAAFEDHNLAIPWLGSLMIFAFTFFAPFIYKGPLED